MGTVPHASWEGCHWEQHLGARWFPMPMVAARAVTLCEAEWVSKDKLGSRVALTAGPQFLLALPVSFGRSITVVTGSLLSYISTTDGCLQSQCCFYFLVLVLVSNYSESSGLDSLL